jgi:ubiquitin-protein ligase
MHSTFHSFFSSSLVPEEQTSSRVSGTNGQSSSNKVNHPNHSSGRNSSSSSSSLPSPSVLSTVPSPVGSSSASPIHSPTVAADSAVYENEFPALPPPAPARPIIRLLPQVNQLSLDESETISSISLSAVENKQLAAHTKHSLATATELVSLTLTPHHPSTAALLIGYNQLLSSHDLCSLSCWRRILKEVKHVNQDFNSLRTIIQPIHDKMGILHFCLIPNDGALCNEPLLGRLIVYRTYPLSPPVIHLFTKTGRYNVDIFHIEQSHLSSNNVLNCYMTPSRQSSMCFDILRSVSSGGTWRSDYTLSALFATLMQALVAVKVEQSYGEPVLEFITMERLKTIRREVDRTLQLFGVCMPKAPQVETLKHEGFPIPCRFFSYPKFIYANHSYEQDSYTISQPIKLQVNSSSESPLHHSYTIGLDLSDLTRSPLTVFSVILSNEPHDPTGLKPSTVLVRNGVTASAAKKRRFEPIQWFYHGEALQRENLKVIITVAWDQFVIAVEKEKKTNENEVKQQESKEDEMSSFAHHYYLHGDGPISFLSSAELDELRSNEQFYLTIFLRTKSGSIGRPVCIETFRPKFGLIHPRNQEFLVQIQEEINKVFKSKNKGEEKSVNKQEKKENRNKSPISGSSSSSAPATTAITAVSSNSSSVSPDADDFPTSLPVFISLTLTGTATESLQSELFRYGIDNSHYSIQSIKDFHHPAHITMAFYKDFLTCSTWRAFIQQHYLKVRGDYFSFYVTGFVQDRYCVALMVKGIESIGSSLSLPGFPAHRQFHITMALNGKAPVYSNDLIRRLTLQANQTLNVDEQIVYFPNDGIKMEGKLEFQQKLFTNKKW